MSSEVMPVTYSCRVFAVVPEHMAEETTLAEAGPADGVQAKRPRLECGGQKVPDILRKDLFDPKEATALKESVMIPCGLTGWIPCLSGCVALLC
jgi:hypothetical protein